MTDSRVQIDLSARWPGRLILTYRSRMSEQTRKEESDYGGQCTGRDGKIAYGDELVVRLGLSDCNGAGASSVLVHLQNLTSSLA